MALKLTLTGAFIYVAMLALAAGFVLLAIRRQRAGQALFGLGFGLLAAAVATRWAEVGHVPLQSMFEVFLVLAAVVYPLALAWRRLPGPMGHTIDPLIALAVLIPVGFVFSDRPQHLPPALQSSLFLPHVAAYVLSYVVLFKAGIVATMSLAGVGQRGSMEPAATAATDCAADSAVRLVRLGFPLMTVGLILGAWWGKLAWGDYWNWDPKELWSLATWLVFLGCLHWPGAFGARRVRWNMLLVVTGTVFIIITLLWVNLGAMFSSALHGYAK